MEILNKAVQCGQAFVAAQAAERACQGQKATAERLPIAGQVLIESQRQPLLDVAPPQADALLHELPFTALPPQSLGFRIEGGGLHDERREIEAKDGGRFPRGPRRA